MLKWVVVWQNYLYVCVCGQVIFQVVPLHKTNFSWIATEA